MSKPEVSLSHEREGSNAPLVLRPQTLGEYMELAKMLSESDIVPKEFKGKPGNVLVALQMGAEVGLHPVQALQSIAVINGKPSIYGDAGLALVMRSPDFGDIEETDDGQEATCKLIRKNKPTPTVRSFSMTDAQVAKVYESDGRGGGSWKSLSQRTTWMSYPKRMRQMRARWWAMRDTFPDVLKGLAGREEVEDQGDEPKVGPEAAKRVGEEVERMAPRRASEVQAEPPVPTGGEVGRALTAEELAARGIKAPPEAAEEKPASAAAGEPEPQQSPPAEETSRVSEEPPAPAPPEQAEPAPAPAPAVSKPQAKLRFSIGKATFETAGITKEQMSATFHLVPKVDAKHGKDYSASLLVKEFGVVSRNELDAEAAGKFIIRLQEILGEA